MVSSAVDFSAPNITPRPFWWSDTAVLLWLALAKLLLHLLNHPAYGYFRDELYYIACSDHLAWGYVDHPPLSIVVLAGTRALLGDSLVAIRLPAALAGAAAVVLTGLLARELGGGRFAQWTAALAYMVMGTSLAVPSFFSMNAFDQLFWIAAAWFAIRALRSGDSRLWLPFGAAVGLGLLNKISIGFFAFGLVVGLALTPQRQELRNKWMWLGGALAVLLLLPNLLWQVANGFPTLEFMRNAQQYKIAAMTPVAYLAAQAVLTNPVTAPVWLTGLGCLLLASPWRRYRTLGFAYLAVLMLFIAQGAKPYYLAPAYPMLIAAGSVALESFTQRRGRRWLQPATGVWLLTGGIVLAPLALPILPPDMYVAYTRLIGMQPPQEERNPQGDLPQHLADRIGWENLVAAVAHAYQALPPEDRARAAILAGNYGEAGAIDFFGARHGLPPAISPHNNYWLWGPRGASGEVIIVVGIRGEELAPFFESVQKAGTVISTHAMPYETNLPVFVCRKLRVSIDEAWQRIKRFV